MLYPGRLRTLARRAASLTSSQTPGRGEARGSKESTWGEDLEVDWLSSGGVPPLSTVFSVCVASSGMSSVGLSSSSWVKINLGVLTMYDVPLLCF